MARITDVKQVPSIFGFVKNIHGRENGGAAVSAEIFYAQLIVEQNDQTSKCLCILLHIHAYGEGIKERERGSIKQKVFVVGTGQKTTRKCEFACILPYIHTRGESKGNTRGIFL